MISLCMIVKNEELYLERCLNSISKYVDEIVIVDTGSKDKTKNIAFQFTDKVFDFKWCNDFAKARNFSLDKASNDWVLVLDGDEIVKEIDVESIRHFTKDPTRIGRIKIISILDKDKEAQKSTTRVSRLFNKKNYEFEGTIHEQLIPITESKATVQSIELSVEHFGYTKAAFEKNDKKNRNIKLLLNEINRKPKDSYLRYQLGKTYFISQNYIEAIKSFQLALRYGENFNFEYMEDLIVSYGYALLNATKYEEALKIIGYEQYYKNSPDYKFMIGLIYMNNGYWNKAIEYFEACIGEKEGMVEGVNTYQPNYNIGVIYECLGHKEEAIKQYRKCGDYFLAKERVKILNLEKTQ